MIATLRLVFSCVLIVSKASDHQPIRHSLVFVLICGLILPLVLKSDPPFCLLNNTLTFYQILNVMLGCFRGRDSIMGVKNAAGLLKVKVIRGVNLAIRDMGRRSSDPYVILTWGRQKVRTRIVYQSCNPEWNEYLTLYPSKSDLVIHLAVFDHDTFSADDPMGEAQIDMKPYMDCNDDLKKNMKKSLPQEGAKVSIVMPTKENCLAAESCIVWRNNKLVQEEMRLVLKNVECGEIEIELTLEGGRTSHSQI